jgi:hypothetical protein
MSLMSGNDGIAAAGPEHTEMTSAWRREHAGSGLTSSLILTYVEREAGGQAVRRMLALAELSGAEQSLRDENHWFSYERKLALWRAAEEVLGDPDLAEHVGASVLDLSVAAGLKQTLRALGTPGFVYGNVARANAKFNWAHQLEVLEKSAATVRMRYTDVSGVGYHRYDCSYTKGLLATVPQLFGLPLAHVAHPVCGARGDAWCEFDVRWTAARASSRARPSRSPAPVPRSRRSARSSTPFWRLWRVAWWLSERPRSRRGRCASCADGWACSSCA